MGRRGRTLLWLVPAVAGIFALTIVASAPVYELLLELELVELDPNDPDRMFLKVIRRILLIPLVALILLWLRPWKDGTPEVWGIRGPHVSCRAPLLTYGFTWAIGVGVLAVQLAAGWLEWEDPLRPEKLAGRLAKYVPTGLIIGFLEEWFFRGWLWRRIGRARRTLAAAVITSVIYALVHAFRPGALATEVTIDAAGARDALLGWFGHAFDLAAFGPRFLGLFLFGMVLSAVFRRRGNLWSAVAVHAAGVALVHVYGALTDRVVEGGLVGSRVLLDGLPGWIVLGTLAAVLWCRGHVPTTPESGPDEATEPEGDRNP
ncbi:MAG: CPBP family intramembrane metalloprotease [Planctomycetota bacterium]|nr:CPBP family intramembrane metalloprotease [Planctomycetota bacterium]